MSRSSKQDAPAAAASTSPGRKRLFYAIALALPLVFFGLLEAGLRLAGFGASPPLFVPAAGAPDYLQPNAAAIERFFAAREDAPSVSIDTTYFRRSKAPGTFRIFVQGGSSAAGFPYGKWASMTGMLQRRLRHTFPDRDIEVISTAMSAVNTYALLTFVDEILALEPDAVLIYAGHNEYLGILGVGSALASGYSRDITLLALRLRQVRVYRLLESLYGALRPARPRPTGTLMAHVAARKEIPYDSELYQRGLEQFQGNLAAILTRYRAAGVPVFIGTLASNERGQSPFIGGPAASVDRQQWDGRYEAGEAALSAGDLQQARSHIEGLLDLDEAAADAHFLQGRLFEALGDTSQARRAYLASKDRDRLRFRAPEAMNEVIKDLAAEHGAVVVDVQAALARASAGGMIGSELMLEHLHPNVRGYFLLADAYFDALRAADLIGDWNRSSDDAAAWRNNPVTEIDRLAGEYRVERLKADWPFEQSRRDVELPAPTDEIETIAQDWYLDRVSWVDAMNRALTVYQRQGNHEEAVKIALNVAEAFVFLDNPQYVAGQLLLRTGETDLALAYFHRAATLAPRKTENLLALGRAFYLAGRKDEARATLQTLLKVDPDNAVARQALRQLEEN